MYFTKNGWLFLLPIICFVLSSFYLDASAAPTPAVDSQVEQLYPERQRAVSFSRAMWIKLLHDDGYCGINVSTAVSSPWCRKLWNASLSKHTFHHFRRMMSLHRYLKHNLTFNEPKADSDTPHFAYARLADIEPCPSTERTGILTDAYSAEYGDDTNRIYPMRFTRRYCRDSVPVIAIHSGSRTSQRAAYCSTTRLLHQAWDINGRELDVYLEGACKLFIRNNARTSKQLQEEPLNEDKFSLKCGSNIAVVCSLAFSALCLLTCFIRNRR